MYVCMYACMYACWCKWLQVMSSIPVCELCDLYLPWCSITLGPAGHVDCVAKETVSWHPPPDHPSHHCTTVDPNTHLRR